MIPSGLNLFISIEETAVQDIINMAIFININSNKEENMFLSVHSYHALGLMQKELVNPFSLFMIVEHQSL